MANKNVIIVADIETTGLDPDNGAEIVQIAARALNPFDFSDHHCGSLNLILKPDHPETAQSTAIEIIGPVLWDKATRDGLDQKVALEKFYRFVEQANPEKKNFTKPIMCGHNFAGFDQPFLRKKLFEYKVIKSLDEVPWSYHVLDTVSIAFLLFESDPMVHNFKLDTFLSQIGIARKTEYHDAMEDVNLTCQALQRSMKFFRECRRRMRITK